MNQLTKSSSSEEIKMYFNAILKLAKASEKYPVNLDEVWMLVYNRRDYAVDALKKDFIENEDFISFIEDLYLDTQANKIRGKYDKTFDTEEETETYSIEKGIL